MGLTAERDTVQESKISASSRILHPILCLAVAQEIINRSATARCRLDIRPVRARFLVNRVALRAALCSVLLTKYYLDDHIKSEMGGACGMYVVCILGVGGETSHKETTLET